MSRPDSSLEELEETTPAGAVSFLVPGRPASPLTRHPTRPCPKNSPAPVLKTAQVTPCLQLIQSVRLRPVAATDPVLPKSPSKGNTHPGRTVTPSESLAGPSEPSSAALTTFVVAKSQSPASSPLPSRSSPGPEIKTAQPVLSAWNLVVVIFAVSEVGEDLRPG